MTQGFELITDVFTNTSVFGYRWMFSLALIFVVMVLISRDINDWKVLAFPVTILFSIIGLKPGIIWIVISGILFASEIFFKRDLGNFAMVFTKRKPSAEETALKKAEENSWKEFFKDKMKMEGSNFNKHMKPKQKKVTSMLGKKNRARQKREKRWKKTKNTAKKISGIPFAPLKDTYKWMRGK